MRSICFQAIQRVAVEEIPAPQIEQDSDVIVEVQLAGLCGSDLHPYFGREVGLDAGTVMGHEFVGHVVAVGSEVRSFAVGDRVCSPFTTSCGDCFYCGIGLTSRCERGQLFGWRSNGQGLHGGQAERVRVPLADGTLLRVPDSMSSETALLLGDNLVTGFFGVDLVVNPARVETDCLLCIGCGNVGLLAIQSARRIGVKTLFAFDPNPTRAEMANQLGARAFSEPEELKATLRDATDGRGADGVMEFVGLPDAQRLAFNCIRPGGTMAVIGCHCSPHFTFSPSQAYDKNLSIRTGRCPARSQMERMLTLLGQSDMDFSWCFTHTFAPDQGVAAYRTFAGHEDGCIKAAIKFS